MTTTNNKNNPPVRKYRLGNIECATWEKTAQDGKTFYQFSFKKSFKDAEGQWQSTHFFNKTELALIAALAHRVLAKEIMQSQNTQAVAQAPAQSEQGAEPASGDIDEVPF